MDTFIYLQGKNSFLRCIKGISYVYPLKSLIVVIKIIFLEQEHPYKVIWPFNDIEINRSEDEMEDAEALKQKFYAFWKKEEMFVILEQKRVQEMEEIRLSNRMVKIHRKDKSQKLIEATYPENYEESWTNTPSSLSVSSSRRNSEF